MEIKVTTSGGSREEVVADMVERHFEKDYYILLCYKEDNGYRKLVAEFLNPISVRYLKSVTS